MNRVFKVIWNRTKGCYVVVAETAKNMTKRSSLSVVFSKMVGATAVAVMLTGVMMPTDALGAPIKNGVGATAENDGGIAIGDRTNARGDYSVAMGTDATVGKNDPSESESQNGIAIGHGATVKVEHAGDSDITDKSGGIAIGHSATTTEINTIAIGTGSKVSGAQAVAIGRNSKVLVNNGVAMGNETRVNSLNGFALGNNARAGYDDTGAPVAGLANDQAFGSNARAWGGTSMAFGNNAKAGGGGDIAMGNGAQSRASWGVAIGNGAKALAQAARAIGANSTASGINSAAMGWDSVASGASSIAIGETSKATTAHSIAMSTSANVASEDAIAIGHNAQVDANQQRSIALGANSKTANVVSTANQLVNGLWYQNYAGGSADSTLSVGSDTLKRTITNVAAGRVNAQSTDAINGSQLYGVANTLGNLASTTKGILGGNAALDPDTGNLSMSNIGNTGKGTIHDAIKFNKDTIDKGLNFDANTGGPKNNLLGSKVTIKGDGSNINAAITQANGDTTINMTLGNTIKVGTANPVTINGTTGHVTGLQNKDWNEDNPVPVSGRAATEDQLKKVNDKVNTNKAAIDKNTGDINTNKQNITKNAGDIANNKTDIAKNKQDISTINTTINKGLNFAGDTGTVSNRKLGDTVTVKGGATGALSDGNIGVDSDGNGTLNVKLAKTLTGLDSVTAGNTKIDGNGLTVGGKTYVSPTGLNANNQKITNVANGSDPNDAVNYSQLQAAIGGTAKASTVKAKDANVTVTESTNAAGGKEYTVGLGNKITVGTAHPVTVDGDAGHVTGLTNTDWDEDHPAAVSGRGATEDQLKKVNDKVNTNKTQIDKNKQDIADNKQNITNNAGNIAQNKQDISNINTKINKGLNFAGDTGTVSNRQLGDTVTVKGGATGTLSDGNIGVESDGNGTLNVKLAKTLTGLDSVTAGNTKIDSNGLTVGGKTYVSPTGLNANDQKVTNVANGDVSANSKDAVNGGQLHEAKNELNTNISNAKTELINKGLRFDADNNDVKTNKLGSKVTVNGDGNITTEITQTGDDTTIGVKLNKNLNVQTLTATDTVKAGGVTMGKHADSNNYVTGLDNKDWDVNTTNPVSGRAATEDQLKKISDVVKNQGAAATDYRLVKNTAAADNAYTVDSNGDVDLTVEDKNHAGQKETVKIKDVASKSSLDKLNDRAVKYNLDNGAVDKTKVTYEGPTYANKTGGTHVTNVAYATGNDGSEAVNVDYLKDKIKDSEDALTNKGLKFDANSGGVKTNKLGSTVTVKGEGNDADANYSGENIKTFITQDQDGNTTIDVKMNKNLKANSVAIAGKNGQDGVTIKGGDAKNGVDGTSINRLVTEDKDGNTHTLATLDDGMMYGGDTGNVIKKKLNNQVNVKGGISDESKLATEDNIGVVSDGSDTLKLRLAKELKGLTSATFTNGGNNTVINGDGMTITPAGGNAVSLTKDGLNNGGNKITNVANGTDPNDAVNKSQLDKATAAASTTVSAGNNITVTPSTNANGSKNYEVSLKDQVTLGSDATKQIAMDGTTGTIKAGDKVTIDGNKGTIKAGNVTIDGENGTIKAGDKVTIDGKDGKIAAGKVSVDGKDGYVTGLENKDWDPDNITSGRAATEDQLQKSHKSLDNKINNLGDKITKKGLNFGANSGNPVHKNLGETVSVVGTGDKADTNYSSENIKTKINADGNIEVMMDKDLKTDSVTTDKVKVGKNGKDGVSITGPNGADGTDGKVGITGKDGKDAVSMSGKDGVGHIGLTGKDGRNADITVDKGDPDLDGNNITRIKYQDENGKTHQVATKDDGMKYGGDSGSVIKKKLNEQVNVVGGITDASKLTTEDNLGVVSDGTGNLKVRMAKDLKGLETVTTKDAAGNTTVMNGGGVTITPAGGNAVSLTKDGLNNGGNTITNVGPGVNGTDAVNVNQLKGATDGLANAINSVAGETQRVGAHAAAMSALKPIQYDPLEPTQVMAGIGNYRGETAAALGVAHYTAEDTMFHVGVSVGSHHNMVNAGVTRKFGTSDAKKAVPERYKGGPISSMYVMQDEMTALKAKYEKVQRDNEEMRAQIALLMQQAGLK